MKSLECDVWADTNHTSLIHLLAEIPPRRHALRIILQEDNAVPLGESPETFSTIKAMQWPEELLLRREGIYNGQGR